MGFSAINPKLKQKIMTDVKTIKADMGHVTHLQWSAAQAVATSNVGVHAAIALAADVASVTTAITSPVAPRSIIVKGNAAGIAGNCVIHGTNILNESISEVIALNAATAVEGAKAFKTVSQIDLPAETHVGTDTVSVGWGDKLGLPYKLTHKSILYKNTFLDNAVEATEPALTISTTAIESNTIDLNSALNGKVVDAYLIV